MKFSLNNPPPKTDFTSYKNGYHDGYSDNKIQFPDNNYYLLGYDEGKEDDYAGVPNKFDCGSQK